MWRGSVKGKKGEWRLRSRKHRYMLVYDKSLKILWQEEPYPKGDNTEYELHKPENMQMNIFDYMGENPFREKITKNQLCDNYLDTGITQVIT